MTPGPERQNTSTTSFSYPMLTENDIKSPNDATTASDGSRVPPGLRTAISSPSMSDAHGIGNRNMEIVNRNSQSTNIGSMMRSSGGSMSGSGDMSSSSANRSYLATTGDREAMSGSSINVNQRLGRYGGSMGYGGGYGGYGMGMGMGMGSMGLMGMGGMGSMMGIVYSVQSAMYSIGAIMEFVGMSTQAVIHMSRQLYFQFHRWRFAIMTSESRRWLQRKCRKSRLLRWLLTFLGMVLTHKAIQFLRFLVKAHHSDRGLLEGVLGTSGAHPSPESKDWTAEFSQAAPTAQDNV